jgi:hypothetical protein
MVKTVLKNKLDHIKINTLDYGSHDMAYLFETKNGLYFEHPMVGFAFGFDSKE